MYSQTRKTRLQIHYRDNCRRQNVQEALIRIRKSDDDIVEAEDAK